MPRVPDVDRAALDADARAVYDEIASSRGGTVRGPFALWMRVPEIARTASRFGRALRDGPIERRLFELVTLVVARAYGAQYAWSAHARHAAELGLDPAVVDAIRTRRVPPFARDDERLVYELAVELLETRDVSEPSYERAVAAFGVETTILIVTTVGYYALIGTVLKAFDVPVPGGGRPLP